MMKKDDKEIYVPLFSSEEAKPCNFENDNAVTALLNNICMSFLHYSLQSIFIKNKINMISMYGHGICLAPHTPSTKVIDFSMSFVYGIQGARHILICMHDDDDDAT